MSRTAGNSEVRTRQPQQSITANALGDVLELVGEIAA
jgi:hypothetical protein